LFPGTVDPLRAVGSPLFNALEAGRAVPAPVGTSVESVALETEPDPLLDAALGDLERRCHDRADDDVMRAALHGASVLLLRRTFSTSTPEQLADICRLTAGKVGEIPEHEFVYRHLLEAAESAGVLDLAGRGTASLS
jgi:hypothetical protein